MWSKPTTPVLDNFNRANEGPPPSSNWTTGIELATGMKVASNRLTVPAASIGDGYWNVNTFGPDCEVYVTITAAVGIPRLYMRLTTPGAGTVDGYRMDLQDAFPLIYRVDNGAGTSIGSSVGDRVLVGDTMLFRAVGSSFLGYRLSSGIWTLACSATDSTYSTAGYIGVRVQADTDTLDDFGGGTLPSPSIIPDYKDFPKPPVVGGR